MSIEMWSANLPTAINKMLNAPPDENSAVVLAALITLQDILQKFESHEPESKIDTLLHKLKKDFAQYKSTKTNHVSEPTDRNMKCALVDLYNIIYDIEEIIKLLLQGACDEERNVIEHLLNNMHSEKRISVA